ncbi:DNAse I-like superfamily protein [Artemisia annua]|uniref:DNAse I-like superfamily protein n=1 Tax=Artemisia annua TaxID=35608 RepID=A0A2U1PXC1_ARTAN|nr:DNAse I-like superfamily protein [Artemisia annua]
MDRLAAKLEAIYTASGEKKDKRITHSMGGLLVKCFMSLHNDIFEKYVKSWIAIAAPFQGAPGYVTSTLMNGMSFVSSWEAYFFVSKWSMHQLLIECPSIFTQALSVNELWKCRLAHLRPTGIAIFRCLYDMTMLQYEVDQRVGFREYKRADGTCSYFFSLNCTLAVRVSCYCCFQELDNYDNFYKEKVGQYDYSSIYVKRGGTKKDGCGIFYKHKKLELVIEEKIDYNVLAELILDESTRAKPEEKALDSDMNGQGTSSKDHGDPNDPYVRLKRDCVGIKVAFKFKEPYEHCHCGKLTCLLVMMIPVLSLCLKDSIWGPEWADVKLAQAKYLLSRVAQFKKMVSEKFECTPSLLIAGDFNSVPRDKVVQWQNLQQNSHKTGEPKFTNYTPKFTATIDYILFSPSEGIKPIGYLELPEVDSVSIKGGLPITFTSQ